MSSNLNEIKLGIVETSEDFIHLGVDTTPVNVVVSGNLDLTKRDPKDIDAWLEKTATLKGIELEEKAKLLEEGVKFSAGMIAESNRLLNLAGKTIADKAIIIGRFANTLQKLRKGNTDGILWGDWADGKIPLSTRVRQKYMLIASRPDCHEFTYLGVDKMALLCSITRGSKDENAIKSMMMKYKIPYDQDNKLTMDKFKKLIEAMINSEQLLKEGITLDFEQVKSAVKAKVKMDAALKKRLKDAKNSGGEPATLLDKIIDGDDNDSKEKSPTERIQDFNTLSERLIKTVTYVIESVRQPDSDELTGQVDKEVFEVLIQKLEELGNEVPIAKEK
jgi:hypothetical protein